MASKTEHLYHTRLSRLVSIDKVFRDNSNIMSVLIKISHTRPVNYFKPVGEIVFAVYLDREFVLETYATLIRVSMKDFNVAHRLEVFVHPHPGFLFSFSRLSPGNKIKIKFRGRHPDLSDIERYKIYWDNNTGVYLSKVGGEVDAETRDISGHLLVFSNRDPQP
jgi:hypothetical protein